MSHLQNGTLPAVSKSLSLYIYTKIVPPVLRATPEQAGRRAQNGRDLAVAYEVDQPGISKNGFGRISDMWPKFFIVAWQAWT